MGRSRDPGPPDARAREGAREDEVRFAGSVGGDRRGPLDRGRALLGVAVATSLLIIGVGLAGPRGDGPGPIDLADLLPQPSGSEAPTPARPTPAATPSWPPATPLPDVEAFADGGLDRPFPVEESARALLDPATGRIRHLTNDFVEGLYASDAGGTLCICRSTPWDPAGTRARIVVVRWDDAGVELQRLEAMDLRADAPPIEVGSTIVLDIALTSDGSAAVVASATLVDETWTYRADAFAVATGAPLWSRVLGRRPLHVAAPEPTATPSVEPGSPATAGPSPIRADRSAPASRIVAQVSVRISPADDLVAVTVIDGSYSVEGAPAFHRSSWRIAPDGADGLGTVDPGEAIAVSDDPLPENGWCQGEAFATPERYVAVCASWGRSGRLATFVRLAHADGSVIRDIPISAHGSGYGPGLIDATTGVLYLWDAVRHVLVRLDLETGDSRVASHGIPPRGRPVPGTGAGGELPLGDRRTAWTSLASRLELWIQTPLVGSRDGAYLYAAGLDVREDRLGSANVRSTGIWVFDAATLELVRIIAPAATHDALSLTADGRHLLALGIAGLDEQGRPSDWATSVSVFDAQTGTLLQRFGDPAPQPYQGVSLVWPPPFE